MAGVGLGRRRGKDGNHRGLLMRPHSQTGVIVVIDVAGVDVSHRGGEGVDHRGRCRDVVGVDDVGR